MRNSLIILKKQLKDTLKNKTVLIQFILFPVMTLIMENAIKIDGMPELFFTKLFSVMYIGMAPLTSVASFAYTQQFKKIMDDMSFAGIKIDNICILAINAMLMMALFFIAFRKKGLE